MATAYFRIARKALGLTSKEFSQRLGRTIRSVQLYENGVLEPAPEVTHTTEQLVSEMAEKLQPYLTTRAGTHKTFYLHDFEDQEHFEQVLGEEFKDWQLGQYRAFLGHVMVVLEAKGLKYQLIYSERKEG